MTTLQTFLVLCSLIFPTTTGAQTCEPSSCPQIRSQSSLKPNPTIRFPFRLQSQPDRCGYPRFDLSCNDRNQTIVSMPSSGGFAVNSVYYGTQQIQVNDPDNCMPGRYLLSSAVDYPFLLDVRYPDKRRRFTFLNCTSDVAVPDSFMLFSCLSGRNYSVGVVLSAQYRREPLCRVIKTVSLSLDYWDGTGSAFYDDVTLTWAEPVCGPCEFRGGSCGFKSSSGLEIACSNVPGGGLPKGVKYGLLAGAGVCGLLLLTWLAFRFSGRRDHRPIINVAASITPQPAPVTTGLPKSVIESYTKFMFGERGSSEALPDAVNPTCPICLCEYKTNEEVRIVPDCEHYFHVHCIDEWLQRNATCPLCRVSAGTASLPVVSRPSLLWSTMENPIHLLP